MKIKKVVGKKKSYLVHKKKYNQLLKEQKIKTKLFLATKHTAKEKKIFDEMLWKERRQYSMFENFRITKEINNLNKLDAKDAKVYKSNLNKLTTKTERVVSKLYDNNYRVNINRIYFGDGNDGYMTLGHLFSQFKTAIPTNTKEYQQVKQTVETALERLSKLKLSDTPYLKTAPLYLGDIKQYKYKKDGTVNLNSRENLKVKEFNDNMLKKLKDFDISDIEWNLGDDDDSIFFDTMTGGRFTYENYDDLTNGVKILYNNSNPNLVENIHIDVFKVTNDDLDKLETYLLDADDKSFMFNSKEFLDTIKKQKTLMKKRTKTIGEKIKSKKSLRILN